LITLKTKKKNDEETAKDIAEIKHDDTGENSDIIERYPKA
jgi:hypothetical protein